MKNVNLMASEGNLQQGKMKFFRQHGGALSCYLLLVLWIFLLLAAMYRFMSREPSVQVVPQSERQQPADELGANAERVRRFCNERFDDGAEGHVGGEFVLLGATVIFRHGLRGPLVHLRNSSAVKCNDPPPTPPFWANASKTPGFTQMLGPFHSFPLAPTECAGLGQLTPQGAEQLQRLGSALRTAYSERLALSDSTRGSAVSVFATRYRRTFQSAIALLHGLLAPLPLPRHVQPFQEAPSVFFCFSDCACAAAERLRKALDAEAAVALRSHPAVTKLAAAAAPFEGTATPKAVLDALLVTSCHGSPSAAAAPLAAYLEWEARRLAPRFRPLALLRAHPLLRHVGAQLLRFVAAPTPRLVLYAGHDRTLEHVAAALGLGGVDAALPPFAARLVVELYRKGLGADFFFRLLLNGRDVTSSLSFCRSGLVPYEGVWGSEGNRVGVTASLCPLESIVRFLHDDYFAPFNATNAKDACSMHF
ncbi:2-phosphoxylose phosphatase 1 isoform X2 [Neocloeon triangulifer]|nr:2-phosphoxylose phosphatase 1 isoform X2 [Neocloeon triangulifer]